MKQLLSLFFFFQDGEKNEDRGEAGKEEKKQKVNYLIIVLFI